MKERIKHSMIIALKPTSLAKLFQSNKRANYFWLYLFGPTKHRRGPHIGKKVKLHTHQLFHTPHSISASKVSKRLGYIHDMRLLGPIRGFLALRAPAHFCIGTPHSEAFFSAFRAPTYDNALRSNVFSYSRSALQTAQTLCAPPFFQHRSPLQSKLCVIYSLPD